jgi:N6-adenosine-specific RNA methylase IME4
LEEVCSLPVPAILAEDAVCWLWVPNRHLLNGLGAVVLRAWGFRPVTTLAWIKPRIGLGYYVRNSHENVALGIRGKVLFTDRGICSWFKAPAGEHSQKPGVLHSIAERAYPGPRIELFARKPKKGWEVWGEAVGDNLDWTCSPERWKEIRRQLGYGQ